MGKTDLNDILDYGRISPYILSSAELLIISANPPTDKDHWRRTEYKHFKIKLKRDYTLKQNDLCAYCRCDLEPEGHYEHLDHVVPQSIKPEWMLEIQNLVVSCAQCNFLKNADETLTLAHTNATQFPNSSAAFIIFNPHFDLWSDHFIIEDGLFLTAKANSKGEKTIEICHLFRYNIPVKYARLQRLSNMETFRAMCHRLYATNDPTSAESMSFVDGISELFKRIDRPNPWEQLGNSTGNLIQGKRLLPP